MSIKKYGQKLVYSHSPSRPLFTPLGFPTFSQDVNMYRNRSNAYLAQWRDSPREQRQSMLDSKRFSYSQKQKSRVSAIEKRPLSGR